MKKRIFYIVVSLIFLQQVNAQIRTRYQGISSKPIQTSPLQIMVNSFSKKVGRSTTLTITKRTPDWKTKSAENSIVSATTSEVNPDNIQQVCRTEKHRYTAENLDQDIMNPNALGNIKLGAVYSLENMQSGNYNIISTNRSPINIYITNAAQHSKLVEHPDEVNLQAALDEVRAIPYPVTPSGLSQYLESEQVTSSESLDMAAGLSYSGFGFKASEKFGYNSENFTNKFLLNYSAANYIAYAVPTTNGALFTDPNQSKNFTPVYINQIVYGSKLLVFFEENVSQTEVKNGFSASTNAIGSINASLDIDVKNRMKKTTFKIYLFGSNEQLFIETGLDAMLSRVNGLLGNLSIKGRKSPLEMGQPISYQLKYLDGDIAVTSCKVEDMPQKICGPNPLMPLDLLVTLESFLHGGYGIDGNIKASLIYQDNEFWSKPLYTIPSQARVGSKEGKTIGPVATLTIPSVSKEVRDGGFLRLYGIWNSNGDYFMIGINLTTGPFLKNIYYIDIPLKSILAASSTSNGFSTTMDFKEMQHSTTTFFTPTISAKFIY